ncbi:DUF3035 domain-containing protein [Pseudogemmobacter sonorensis]|uniref:DUF3035 domain-containing protein n=1 Tax=Pseudogemmobacter sonorensis TaxID=2989681 RepID=UPI0036A97EE1
MRARAGVTAVAVVAALALVGCSPRGEDGAPLLMNIRSNGPDEFGILPSKPLQMPASLSELPQPTPGGSNRTDPTPEADAIAALGGRPQAAGGGVPSADAALFAHAGRFGTESGIRQTLAAEDVDWRRRNPGRLLERLFNVNVYHKAYEAMSLDQHAELARWRARGVRTPSAPPDPATLGD